MADLSSVLGLSQDDLQQILAQLQPSAADKSQAMNQGLLTLGATLMQGKKGHVADALGQGLLGAQGGYNTELQRLTQQRGANLTQALALKNAAQQMQMYKQLQDSMNGGSQTLAPDGGSAPFPAPGAASADSLMNNAASGTSPPSTSLPTYQPQASSPLGTYGVPKIALQASMIPQFAKYGQMIADYAKPQTLKAGGSLTGMDASGKPSIAITAPILDKGTRINAAGQVEEIPNYGSTMQKLESDKAAVAAAYAPQEGVLPGGGTGVVGNRLGAMFGNGQLPYGANAPAGSQPSAPSATPAPAPAPVQTKLSPEQNKNSEELGANAGAYRTAIGQSSKAQAELGLMKQTLNYFQPDPTLPARAQIAGYMQAVPGVGNTLANAFVSNSATALPAIAALEKLSVGLTAEQSKVFGSREGQQVIGMIKSANAHAGMVPGAPEVVIDAQNGLHQAIIDKGQAALAWKNDPANHGSLDGFSEQWDASHPVSSYVPNMPALQNIAEGKPPGAPRASSATPSGVGAPPQKAAAAQPVNRTAIGMTILNAQKAIKAGADPVAVKQRMQAAGIPTDGL